MFSITNDFMSLSALVFTIVGSVWGLAWWLSNKFNSLMSLFYGKIDNVGTMILEKLEYHERHDDSRFSSLGESINDLRIRNATADALLLREHPIPRRD